jgi:hypothetical protein
VFDRCWKCVHLAYIVLVLLPTLLRDFVPAVHRALLAFVYALRRLLGQVVSVAEANRLGVMPGSRVLDKVLLVTVRKDLVRGLVMLEGSFPCSSINPAAHHFVHYGEQTSLVGSLRALSMHCFETNNKKIKGLVRSTKNPLCSLANNIQLDISTRYLAAEASEATDMTPGLRLLGRSKMYRCVLFNKH